MARRLQRKNVKVQVSRMAATLQRLWRDPISAGSPATKLAKVEFRLEPTEPILLSIGEAGGLRRNHYNNPERGVDVEDQVSESMEHEGVTTTEAAIDQSSLGTGGHSPGGQSNTQPRFRCPFPNCHRTYERQDHLSRHVKSLHENERAHKCADCGKGFNRADLLNRHRAAHSKNGITETLRRRTGKACQSCIRAKTKCDEERPCKRCKTRQTPCVPTETRTRSCHGVEWQDSSPASASRDDDAARAIVSLSTADLGDFTFSSNAPDDYLNDGMTMTDLDFPDFFEQIIMSNVTYNSTHDALIPPPNVSNFTQDVDLGPLDFDFSFLSSGLTRPSTAQGMHRGDLSANDADSTPQSDVQLRSEAFKKSPWSWNHWIPDRTHNTFSEQTEINIEHQRVSEDDQLTPGNERRLRCDLENEARDRMIRVVTHTADTRLAIPSFPSLELLEDLIDVFLMEENSKIDSFIHTASFNAKHIRTELLLAMVAKGATYIALAPVWKMGLVIQEVVRIAVAQVFETDNSTTRELQPLQAYLLWLNIGIWCGFRRKTEIASSFLQPAITMLTWSNAFSKFRYKDVIPTADDDDDTVTAKWAAWIEQESFKRLVMHAFIHDSQVAIAHIKNPLVSPAQMLLPLPASRRLWLAQNAHSWRNLHLEEGSSRETALPSVMTLVSNIRILDELERVADKALCLLIASHSMAYEVFHFRQQALLLADVQVQGRKDRWLTHASRQKDLYEDLSALATYCELQTEPASEALFTLEYLMMLLHVSLENIQLFSGKSGEDEARKVYPHVRAWTEETNSRTTIWHAGQVLRIARSFERTRLRDFYAIAVYHSTLTLWVYGMVKSNTARKSGLQTPVGGRQSYGFTNDNHGHTSSQQVFLDGEEDKTVRAFRQLGHGKPCLRSSIDSSLRLDDHWEELLSNACPLSDSRAVMSLGASILRYNYPRSQNGLPPLVENLANLMTDLSKLSGRDT